MLNTIMRKYILILSLLFFVRLTSAQNTDFAATVLYDFQSAGIGMDARVLIPIHRSLFFVPRISYFPSFNDVHEFYLGGELTKYIAHIGQFNPYAFVGVYYNNWINNEDFNNAKATKQNTTAEPGVGILWYRGCLNPYIETRYSTKWKEFTLGIGIIFHMGDCLGRGKGASPWLCPSF